MTPYRYLWAAPCPPRRRTSLRASKAASLPALPLKWKQDAPSPAGCKPASTHGTVGPYPILCPAADLALSGMRWWNSVEVYGL